MAANDPSSDRVFIATSAIAPIRHHAASAAASANRAKSLVYTGVMTRKGLAQAEAELINSARDCLTALQFLRAATS